MIKVMDKTFGILEEIVKATPHPMGPLALAEKLGMNRATCSRILRELLDAGYILQVSRQAGYVAGPRILTLNNMASFESRLLEKAAPLLEEGAKELNASMLLSQIHMRRRYVLFLVNYSRINIHLEQLAYEDIFSTATGVVEMADRTREEQLECYEKQGSSLPGFEEKEGMIANMEAIRRQGFFHIRNKRQGIFAVPVFVNGRFAVSLGCSILREEYQDERIKQILSRMKMIARDISHALSSLNSAG